MFAYEKQAKDNLRLQSMLKSKDIIKLIVIWENTFVKHDVQYTITKLCNIINNVSDKKELLWI